MTVCCEVCQHPACWKAELDIQRSSLHNQYGYFNIPVYYDNNSACRYDGRSECIVQIDGSLPTYKTLDLLESGFPSSSCGAKETTTSCNNNNNNDDVTEIHLPQISTDEKHQPKSTERERNASFPFTNATLSNYLKKLCERHDDDVADEENNTKNHDDVTNGKHRNIVFKTLRIEDVQSFGDEYTKVYTWIPGKKAQDGPTEERESKEKVIALKMIDGADLPTNCATSDDNKHRHKLRSQTTGLSGYRRRTLHHIPPLGTEEHEDYIQLLRYINLTRLKCDKISMNNQDVRIPSPLRTARVKLYDSSDENRTPRYVPKPQQQTPPDDEDPTSPRSKTMYIRNGVVLSKSPVLKRPERVKATKRTPLPLTRVSVPKKAVRKLPLFDHCSSSIKKTDLPDVTMEPISGSENTSVLSIGKSSANQSLRGDVSDVLHHTAHSSPDMVRFPSPDMVRVPASSPMSSEMSASPMIFQLEKESPTLYNIPSEENLNSIHEGSEPAPQISGEDEQSHTLLGRTERGITEGDSPGRLFLDFEGEHKLHADRSHMGTCIAPSAIMISKASKADHIEMQDDRRISPTLSCGSKGSLDGWLLDKDIISRTYDKYQSFSPFKTPHCSAHVIRDDKRNPDMRVPATKRQILPPSLHNLDQYLPGRDESLQNNPSYITRCLSPSRSMFIRQQKQPPIANVPSEIIVSRFPLLPAITKSQIAKSPPREEASDQKHNGADIACPESPRFVSERVTSFMDDDFDEEVEEVLLNKEAFSSFDLNNNSPQPVTSDLHVIGTDSQPINIGPSSQTRPDSQTRCPDSTARNEKVMTSLDVNNRDIRQHGSNFLLLPNQGSNIVIHSSHDDDDDNAAHAAVAADSADDVGAAYAAGAAGAAYVAYTAYTADAADVVTTTVVADTERRSNSPEVCLYTALADQIDDTVPPSNEDVLVLDERTCLSRDNVGDDVEVRSENIETRTSVGMCDINRENTDDELGNSRKSSLKASTSAPRDGNVKHVASSITGEQVDERMKTRSMSPDYQSEIESEYSVHADDVDEVETRPRTSSEDSSIDDDSSQQQDSGESNTMEDVVAEMVDESIKTKDELAIADNDNDVTIENIEVKEDVKVMGNVIVIDASEAKSDAQVPISETKSNAQLLVAVKSRISPSDNKLKNKPSESSSGGSVDLYYGSSLHLPEEPIQSVMADIFESQLKEKSSLYLTPSHADDFTEGLDLDLEVEEEIGRAIHGLEEFVLDSYEVEDDQSMYPYTGHGPYTMTIGLGEWVSRK